MRVLLVVNLKSGQADVGLYDYVRELGASGAEVTMRFCGPGGEIADLLKNASSFDGVVAAGGDGTVSAICHALAGTRTPVLAYPAGTANLLAHNLRIPSDPRELARVTIEGDTTDIDLGELLCDRTGSRRGFVIAAGAGYDAAIMEAAEPLKATLGVAAYLVGALQNLTPTVSRFTLELDGRTIHTEGIAVLVMNMVRIQFDLALTHSSDPSDGIFEVVVLRTKNVPELIPAVWAAFLDRFIDNPDRSAGLEIHTASEIHIQADPPLPLQYDGEVLKATTPMCVRVLPRAARMLVSRETSAPR